MVAVAARQVMETVTYGVKQTSLLLREIIETCKALGRKPPEKK